MKILFTFMLALLFSMVSFGENSGKRILVIESYSGDYLWDKTYKEGLESILGGKNSIEYFEMNTKKLPKTEHQKMADLAWEKYIESKPDMVVLGDDAALKYLGEKFGMEKIPVIYLGINNNPRYYFKSQNIPTNMTGVLERPILKRTFDYMKQIYPNAKKALILFDTDITATIVKKEIYYDKDKFDVLGIQTELKLIDNYKAWKDIVLSSTEKYDFMVLGLYQTIKDDAGNYIKPEEIGKWTTENSKVPIFGFWDFSIGKEAAIGGLVLKGKDMGVEAGKIAQDVFNGKDIKKILPVFENEGEFIFSQYQIDKWKIKLPEEIKKKAKLVE